jgi:hypothetical protein
MAIKQVQQVGPQDVVKSTGGRKGGGKFGTMAGLATGAALGAVVAGTGGAALPAIAMGGMTGAATGASLGGLIGEKIKPGREASTAIDRRIQAAGPQMVQSETSEKLKQSLMALHEAPPEVKSQYAPQLVNAYLKSLGNDNGTGRA